MLLEMMRTYAVPCAPQHPVTEPDVGVAVGGNDAQEKDGEAAQSRPHYRLVHGVGKPSDTRALTVLLRQTLVWTPQTTVFLHDFRAHWGNLVMLRLRNENVPLTEMFVTMTGSWDLFFSAFAAMDQLLYLELGVSMRMEQRGVFSPGCMPLLKSLTIDSSLLLGE